MLLLLALIIFTVSCSTVLLASSHETTPSDFTQGPWKREFVGLVSPATVRAIEHDEILRRNYVAIVDVAAGASEWLAARFPNEQLLEVIDSLKRHNEALSNSNRRENSRTWNHRRSLIPRQLSSFGDLISGAAAGDNAAGEGAAAAATDPIGQLGGLLSGGLSSIGDMLLQDVGGAGMFLGIGIGEGAATGLNMSTAENAKAVGAKVAAESGVQSSGLNPAIQNLGSGLTGTLLGAVDVKSLLGGAGGQVGPAVSGLATGIGNGAVSGLKINTVVPPNPNATALPDIVTLFGFGLTNTVASNINVNNLASGPMTQQLMQQLPPAVLSLAQGIGNGAVAGLKLNSVAPPQGTSVPDLAGSFGFGLTQSITSNVDFSNLTQGTNTKDLVMQYLPSAASGFGKGLGQGIPVGLGIQPDPGLLPMQAMPNGTLDVGGISQNFALGLTSRLLANGTVSKLMSQMSEQGQADGNAVSGVLGNVDVAKTAGGFARGIIQGAADGITAMGGMQALLDNKAVTPTGAIPETPVLFDDSLNGSAVGFGQGFGTQGVMVTKTLLQQLNVNVVTQKRSADTIGNLDVRQASVIGNATISNGTTTFNLSSILDADSLSTVMQKSIDVLTCEGIAGLALVALGLTNSGTIPLDEESRGALKQFKDVIPKGVLRFTNNGNNYDIEMTTVVDNLNGSLVNAAGGIKVNGNTVAIFAAFLVIHILFGILVMINVLPAAVGLESLRNMLIRMHKPDVMTWIPKWVNIMWFFIMAPFLIIILVFGVVAMGNAAHIRTAHGVLGLLTVIDGFAAIALHFIVKVKTAPPQASDMQPVPTKATLMQKVRTFNNQVFLILSVATVLTGFADISKISICVTRVVPFEGALAIGFSLAQMFVLGQTISALDIFLEFRAARQRKKAPNGAAAREAARGGGKREKLEIKHLGADA
ncbi:uncharacterized protein BCR38DRAFT_413588 [Pseudomassariella vexata]|uniref:Uncharacterized protein n=1 Tax=Pseudomassariella vexata TaxID=1141098 RepID=A0A1Y2DFY4_9PEZI|nr:uncharacterized protein BCR38DRAFT_413588 [Pseudomassariella vexata]ORY58192.1 hypothetical protein BCR38DRAFT_413588 [Pseudomassariella vexata]